MSADSSDTGYFYCPTSEHRCRTTTHTGTWTAFLKDDCKDYLFRCEDSEWYTKPAEGFIRSDIFYCGLNQELEWGLHLYPKGDGSVPSKKYISVHPILIKNNFPTTVRAAFEISIFDYYCRKMGYKQSFTVQMEEKEELKKLPTFSKFLLRSDDDDDLYQADGYLNVHYSVTVNYEDNLVPRCVITQLFEGFEPFTRDQKFSDVTLLTSNGIKIPAHKVILAGKSPVFAAMFENHSEVKKTNIVKIEDVESYILEDFLQCLYNCRSKFLLQDKPFELKAVCKLFRAAEKYQVLFLKERCVNHLKHNLCEENVCEIYILADIYNETSLKRDALEFINRNASTVIRTSGWREMVKSSPCSLVAELYVAKVERD